MRSIIQKGIILVAAVFFLTASFAASSYAYEDAGINYYDSKKEAAKELRKAMKKRKKEVKVGIWGQTNQDGLEYMIGDVFAKAVRHTGKPKEGDYLKYQYDRYKGAGLTGDEEGRDAIALGYRISYYTDKEQEKAVDEKVEGIMEGLDLDDLSTYEKIAAIHDYICSSTEYEVIDPAGSGDLGRTAYGALVQGKAVCQGYSLAFYRLLLEAGIDNRIIYGKSVERSGIETAHTWNIVKLGDSYYNVDVTWDDTTETNDYFLKNEEDFREEHIRDAEYDANSFRKKYPVSENGTALDTEVPLLRVISCAEFCAEALRNSSPSASK